MQITSYEISGNAIMVNLQDITLAAGESLPGNYSVSEGIVTYALDDLPEELR